MGSTHPYSWIGGFWVTRDGRWKSLFQMGCPSCVAVFSRGSMSTFSNDWAERKLARGTSAAPVGNRFLRVHYGGRGSQGGSSPLWPPPERTLRYFPSALATAQQGWFLKRFNNTGVSPHVSKSDSNSRLFSSDSTWWLPSMVAWWPPPTSSTSSLSAGDTSHHQPPSYTHYKTGPYFNVHFVNKWFVAEKVNEKFFCFNWNLI